MRVCVHLGGGAVHVGWPGWEGLWVRDVPCGQACISPHPQNFLAGPGGGAGFPSCSICVTGVGSLSNCDNEEDGGC